MGGGGGAGGSGGKWGGSGGEARAGGRSGGGEGLMKYFRNPSHPWYSYSPHCSLYSSSDAAKENSFNNQKLPKLRLFFYSHDFNA